jgi:hypothetical protein
MQCETEIPHCLGWKMSMEEATPEKRKLEGKNIEWDKGRP